MELKSDCSSAPSAPPQENHDPPSYDQAIATSTHTSDQPQTVAQPQLNLYPPLKAQEQPLVPPVQRIQISSPVGKTSSVSICPHCLVSVQTRTSVDANMRTHLMCLICCLFCPPLCCVPYCCAPCKEVNHYCPRCGAYIGKFDPWNNRHY